jgi:hypothetical protein
MDIHVCNCIYWYTFQRGQTRAYAFTLLSLLQFPIRFAYWISWISPFGRVTICARYYTDLGALIASAKCLDKSIGLKLTVAEMNSCGFQRPISERRVAIPMDEKSYWLEIYESQIQKWDKSDLIPEPSRPGDASAPKSVKDNYNEFIIRELEGNQLRHQWDSISYIPIESMDDYTHNSIAQKPPRVALTAMLKPTLLQCTLMIVNWR